MKKYIHWTVLLPSVWLICHIYMIGNTSLESVPFEGTGFTYLAKLGALQDFKSYRNIFYAAYIGLFLAIKFPALRGPYDRNGKLIDMPTHTAFLHMFNRPLLVSVFLTTFAYAIAGIILDLTFLLGNM